MAKINDNLFVLGASGMVGKQMIFRNRKGTIILSKRPRHTKQHTDAQLEHMLRFKEATLYAKAALADEETCKAYAEKAEKSGRVSAYNVAVADYLKEPVVRKVNLDAYSGQVGETIVVSAMDDFQVKEVTVEICQSDDSFLEKGNALPNANGLDWGYTTESVNASPTGSKVIISVSDRPGNVTVKELII